MAEIKLVENYSVSLARNSVRDSLMYHGEECIALAMFHPTIDDATQPRCAVCFAPGTLVRTESGYRPIEEIAVDDRVLTEDGTYQRVYEVMSRPFDGTAYQWRTSMMAQAVISTGEHPIWALDADHEHHNQSHIKDGKPFCGPSICEPYHATIKGLRGKRHDMTWVHTHALGERSWVGTRVPRVEADIQWINVPEVFARNKGAGVKRKGPNRFELTEDFLWMIGLYLAEGSSGKRSINFALHEDEVQYVERIVRIFTEHGYTSRISHTSKHGIQVDISSSVLAEWFPAWLGRGCQNKHIPEELMALPPKMSREIINGIWCGDGFKSHNRIGQTSQTLALQIAEILQRNGEQSTIHTSQATTLTPAGNVRKLCYVNLWDSVLSGKKQKQLKGRWFFDGQEQLARVVSHQPISYSGFVYNLEVEGNHTYVVQNTLVHNCFDDIYKQPDQLCDFCYGTTFAGGVKTAARIWSMFTDKTAEETYRDHGVWSADAREIQCEAFPILLEHDYLVRVRQWGEDHTPLEIEGYYEVQQVTRDSMRTGNRFGQFTWDIVGQRANVTELQKNSIITRYPVLNVPFPDFVPTYELNQPPVVPPDTKVVFYPLPSQQGENLYQVQGFTFTQTSPSATWTIQNPLGRSPASVTVIIGGEVVQAQVDFPDIKTIVISFSSPQVGTAEVI